VYELPSSSQEDAANVVVVAPSTYQAYVVPAKVVVTVMGVPRVTIKFVIVIPVFWKTRSVALGAVGSVTVIPDVLVALTVKVKTFVSLELPFVMVAVR